MVVSLWVFKPPNPKKDRPTSQKVCVCVQFCWENPFLAWFQGIPKGKPPWGPNLPEWNPRSYAALVAFDWRSRSPGGTAKDGKRKPKDLPF